MSATPRLPEISVPEQQQRLASKKLAAPPKKSDRNSNSGKPRVRKEYEHRHFFALHPTCNYILAKRWEEKTMQLHKTRLKHAKPSIDNSQPRVYPHLEMRLKGLQIEEERLHDIERKNHILLNRISFQMMNASEVSRLHGHAQDETRELMHEAGDHRRRKDQQRIGRENLTFLQRIEDKAPNYNRVQWLYDRRRNLEHLANIARYPDQYMDTLENYEQQLGLVRKSVGAKKHDPMEANNKFLDKAAAEPQNMAEKNKRLQGEEEANGLIPVDNEEPLVSIPKSPKSPVLVASQSAQNYRRSTIGAPGRQSVVQNDTHSQFASKRQSKVESRIRESKAVSPNTDSDPIEEEYVAEAFPVISVAEESRAVSTVRTNISSPEPVSGYRSRQSATAKNQDIGVKSIALSKRSSKVEIIHDVVHHGTHREKGDLDMTLTEESAENPDYQTDAYETLQEEDFPIKKVASNANSAIPTKEMASTVTSESELKSTSKTRLELKSNVLTKSVSDSQVTGSKSNLQNKQFVNGSTKSLAKALSDSQVLNHVRTGGASNKPVEAANVEDAVSTTNEITKDEVAENIENENKASLPAELQSANLDLEY